MNRRQSQHGIEPGGWWPTWNRFFFSEEAPFGLALTRILLPWVLISDAARRWPLTREIYSSDGAAAPLADNFGVPGFLPEFPGPVAVALNTAMIFLLVTSSIGWCTRFSILGATGLYFYFSFMDCLSTVTKYNSIAMHVMLLLGLSACGQVWSVDAWFRRSQPGLLPAMSTPPRFAIWPQRLVQIFLGMVYFGAAITKMHTPTFFSGDQLMYWMITYLNNEHPLGDYLAQFPLFLVVFAYITIVWEVVFLFAVWQKPIRVPMLLLGVLFHIMTAFTLGLIIFPLVMTTAYLCFVTEEDVIAIRRFLGARSWQPRLAAAVPNWLAPLARWRPQTRWAATGTFAAVASLVMLGAVQAEQLMDVYDLGRPEGPHTLKELSPEEVQRLIGEELPLREKDKYLAIDLGTIAVGEHLLDRRTEIPQGQPVIVQVTLSPPHDDMWVECLLLDKDDHVLTRAGQIVGRESFRASFAYLLDGAFEPGEYTFQIRSANQEVLRKSFKLVAAGGPNTAAETVTSGPPSPMIREPVDARPASRFRTGDKRLIGYEELGEEQPPSQVDVDDDLGPRMESK